MVRPGTTDRRKSRGLNRERAKDMRHDPAQMEELFWAEVRNRKLGGFKFKRQVLIGPYIADFVCLEQKLVVELDGPLHVERKHYDQRRDSYFREMGFHILRFKNEELGAEFGMTLQIILRELQSASPPHPTLSPGGGEG